MGEMNAEDLTLVMSRPRVTSAKYIPFQKLRSPFVDSLYLFRSSFVS